MPIAFLLAVNCKRPSFNRLNRNATNDLNLEELPSAFNSTLYYALTVFIAISISAKH